MPPRTCVTGHPENLPHPLPTIESTRPTRPASGASTGSGTAENEREGSRRKDESEEEQRGTEERVEPDSGQHVRPGVGDEQNDAAERACGGEQGRRDLLDNADDEAAVA